MSEITLYDFENATEIDLRYYPDGMPLIAQPGVRKALANATHMLVRPRSLQAFVAAMFLADRGADGMSQRLTLVLPFLPGARQDRRNPDGDVLFHARSIASMINRLDFAGVVTIDPHSDVMPALIDGCRVVSAADAISIPLGKYSAVISPDAGAEKRAGAVARKLGIPLIHAWKTRNVETGAIAGFGVDKRGLVSCVAVTSKPMLVVDDICDGGGTFIGLAKEVRDMLFGLSELDLHLWVTHGLFTKGTDELREHYSHVYCTDSVEGDRSGVIEVPVCERLVRGDL